MSKQVVGKGDVWIDQSSSGNTTRIGFTQAFLDKHLKECWHVIPQKGKVSKGGVLVSLETNDGLVPVESPLDGVVSSINNTAINFPEKLTADTNVVVIRTGAAKEKEPAKVQARVLDWDEVEMPRDNAIEEFEAQRVMPPPPTRQDTIDERAARTLQIQQDMLRRWQEEANQTARQMAWTPVAPFRR